MKKTYSLFLVACLFLVPTTVKLSAEKIIHISGKVKFQNPSIFDKYNLVWVKKGLAADAKSVDSVRVSPDGTFSLDLNVAKPAFYQLDIVKWQTVTFWAEQDLKVEARGYDTARIKVKDGGFISIDSKNAVNRLINLHQLNRNLDKILLDDLEAESLEARKRVQVDSAWYSFLRENNSYRKILLQGNERMSALYRSTDDVPSKLYLLSQIDRNKNPDYLLSELNGLISERPDLVDAIALKDDITKYIETTRKTQSGSVIPDIFYPDPNGKILDIKSLRGKYVIVDFWASWCGPCRKSIPKLKGLYAQHKEKGLDILSISIDTDKDAWRKAMEEETMPWHQVLSPDKSKTLSDFHIQGVPTLFLIDRDGRILEKFTGYNSRLEEILKSKL